MTKRGGELALRRRSVYIVSCMLLAATFLPLFAYAEQPSPGTSISDNSQDQPSELPKFSRGGAYKGHVATLRLYTSSDVTAVEFHAGAEIIPGVRDAAITDQVAWQLSSETPVPQDADSITTRITSGDQTVDGPTVQLVATPSIALDQLSGIDTTATELVVSGSIATGVLLSDSSSIVSLISSSGEVITPAASQFFSASQPAKLSVSGLQPGDYTVKLVINDVDGSEITNTSTTLSVKAPSTTQPSDGATIPVVKAPIYVDKLEAQPVAPLSTDFAIPVSSTLVAAIKSSGIQVAQQPESSDVRGLSTNALDLDKSPAVPTVPTGDAPLAPTDSGWSLFGFGWYWWVSGLAATWAAGMGLRWWLQRS